jgi:hypothetical protein
VDGQKEHQRRVLGGGSHWEGIGVVLGTLILFRRLTTIPVRGRYARFLAQLGEGAVSMQDRRRSYLSPLPAPIGWIVIARVATIEAAESGRWQAPP